MSSTLPPRHVLLALVIITIWGTNFVAIKVALRELPPLLLCAVRFIGVSVPVVFFVPRPKVRWQQLCLYGMTMFAGQFGLLFLGMKLGMPAGLASLTLQFQVFVTLALAAFVLKERIAPVQVAGALIAFGGFGVVAAHTGGDVNAVGMLCVLLAACSWGCANVVSKQLGRVNPLALVVWGGLFVPVPMLLASVVFEGPGLIGHSLANMGAATVGSLGFIVYGSTLLAYSLWSWLLARHPASSIAPFALLVPVFGMLSSTVLLGEPLPAWKLQAAVLVIAGLVLSLFGPKLVERWGAVRESRRRLAAALVHPSHRE